MDREAYILKAKVAKALAHESRLMLIDALREKEMCVCDLVEMVGSDQSTVSKHLGILKNVGIVQDRREGNKVFYSLKTPCVLNFFQCALEVIRYSIKEQISGM
jgi:DNA-binding transcriptional ArsR family regulator